VDRRIHRGSPMLLLRVGISALASTVNTNA
jgi:hypothetical protein